MTIVFVKVESMCPMASHGLVQHENEAGPGFWENWREGESDDLLFRVRMES